MRFVNVNNGNPDNMAGYAILAILGIIVFVFILNAYINWRHKP